MGQRIDRLDRVGKRVVIWLSNDQAIVLEPRMTGLVLLGEAPDREHLRLEIRWSKGRGQEGSIWFWDRRGLGNVRLYDSAQFASRFSAEMLGPDALAVSAADLRTRLGASRRAIKVALLDQRAIAGVGNLYASEALHLAGLDPRRSCRQLTLQEWRRLQQALREVLEQAILCEGSTLSDGTYRNSLNQAGGYQNHHRVYDRQGQPCKTCHEGAIVRIVQAQRATFYCPNCQRRKRR